MDIFHLQDEFSPIRKLFGWVEEILKHCRFLSIELFVKKKKIQKNPDNFATIQYFFKNLKS